ncbi:PqqD family protein [Desulfovibrio sp. JC010]|uniref:PqqD family protein n=1 Tax=Desulfovibrio sp. JC010 TaxID=2593641 RepID=UPI0013D704E1|nr:PqqD family protein [Desulfovibrio sp. JC010]
MFTYFKDLVPHPIYLKKRYDERTSFTTITNLDLEIFFLNETSSFFLNCVDSLKTINSIVDLFVEEYDVSKDVVSNDIIELVRDLQWKKIIVLNE